VETSQGDSEPLAVRDDILYYRVANRLYAARILASGLGAPTLLAEDSAVPDMHWAFFRQ